MTSFFVEGNPNQLRGVRGSDCGVAVRLVDVMNVDNKTKWRLAMGAVLWHWQSAGGDHGLVGRRLYL